MNRPAHHYLIGSALVLAAATSVAAFRRPFHSTKAKSFENIMSPGTTTTSATLSKAEAKGGRIWNRFANNYAKSPIADEASYQKKLEITRQYLNPETTEALEFGCGTGGTAILHSPYVKNYLALDYSSRMIEICKEKAQKEGVKNVQFRTMGIDSFAPEDRSYDVVLGMSILHLLPNKDEVIAKVHTMLKPGGHFVSSTMCIGDGGFAKFAKYVAPAVSFFGIIPKLNVFTKEELLESMKAAGFEIEQEFHPGKDKAVFLVARKK